MRRPTKVSFISLAIGVLVVAGAGLILEFIKESGQKSLPPVTNAGTASPTNSQMETVKPGLASLNTMEIPYRPSLELRENAESLLTPAILIQQALATNGNIIYPND